MNIWHKEELVTEICGETLVFIGPILSSTSLQWWLSTISPLLEVLDSSIQLRSLEDFLSGIDLWRLVVNDQHLDTREVIVLIDIFVYLYCSVPGRHTISSGRSPWIPRVINNVNLVNYSF